MRENFADFEVAVVYHDDNAGRTPHAHVVVNNTNVSNLRRLQDPDPRALKLSAQRLAKDMGLSYLKDAPKGAAAPPRRTLQRTYVRRAEAELSRRGLYSWVADIRSRMEIARAVARDESDFRSLLGEMGVAVADNSPRADWRDWVYSLADAPTRRISGESLGLSYGRDRLLSRFASGASALASEGGRRLAEAADTATIKIDSRAIASRRQRYCIFDNGATVLSPITLLEISSFRRRIRWKEHDWRGTSWES